MAPDIRGSPGVGDSRGLSLGTCDFVFPVISPNLLKCFEFQLGLIQRNLSEMSEDRVRTVGSGRVGLVGPGRGNVEGFLLCGRSCICPFRSPRAQVPESNAFDKMGVMKISLPAVIQ